MSGLIIRQLNKHKGYMYKFAIIKIIDEFEDYGSWSKVKGFDDGRMWRSTITHLSSDFVLELE